MSALPSGKCVTHTSKFYGNLPRNGRSNILEKEKGKLGKRKDQVKRADKAHK
jgi:hypothetical protein